MHFTSPKDWWTGLWMSLCKLADRMDPLQFAYKAKWGVEDATLTLFNLISSHLDSPGTTVRVIFMDFSSAFKL